MDLEPIRHVAELAELELSEDEQLRLAEDFGRIVAFIAELDAVDTTGIEPTAHLAPPPALRADEPEPGLSHEEALASAPRAAHGGFCVPTFVE